MTPISTIEFLQAFYPDPVRPGRLLVFTSSRKKGQKLSRWAHTLGEASLAAHRHASSREAFFGVALHDPEVAVKVARERWPGVGEKSILGCEQSITALPALWADLDVAGRIAVERGRRGATRRNTRQAAAHRDPRPLPPGRDAALGLLPAVGRQESIIVDTGGGYHVYWLLREPWILESRKERERAKDLLARLQWALHSAARARGWAVDHAADLAQVLRLPGGFGNLKYEPKRRVNVLQFPLVRGAAAGRGGRYEPDDFSHLPAPPPPVPGARLLAAPAPPGAPEAADLLPILYGCAWMQRCEREPHLVPRAQYRAALEILVRCRLGDDDGPRLAHLFSQPHSGYSTWRTDERIDFALRRPHPPTCARLAKIRGVSAFCRRCPSHGRIESPLDLGLRDARVAEDGVADAREPVPGPPASIRPAAAEESANDDAGDLIPGLRELLADLDGAATVGRILDRLTAAPLDSYRRLRCALESHFLDVPDGALPTGHALGALLRSVRGRVVASVCLECVGRCSQGKKWAVRRLVADHEQEEGGVHVQKAA